jgi:hypothetical protein
MVLGIYVIEELPGKPKSRTSVRIPPCGRIQAAVSLRARSQNNNYRVLINI